MFASTSPGSSSNCRLVDDVFISEKVEIKQDGNLLVRWRIGRWVPGFHGVYLYRTRQDLRLRIKATVT